MVACPTVVATPAENPDAVPGLRRLHLEPIGGMAGDMFLGALIDLGVPEAAVAEAVGALGLEGVIVETRRARRGGVGGVRFRVLVGGVPLEGPDPGEGLGSLRPEALPVPGTGLEFDLGLDGVLDLLAASPLEAAVRRRAERMFFRLTEALARSGGGRAHAVRFAGLSGVDFLVDLVGSAAAITWLAPEAVTCGPVNVGGPGRLRGASIGATGGAAPGSLGLLGDAPIVTSRGGERLTPTGAVLLAELVDRFGAPPDLPGTERELRGLGLGRAETADCPNVLEARFRTGGRNRPPSAVPAPGGTTR